MVSQTQLRTEQNPLMAALARQQEAQQRILQEQIKRQQEQAALESSPEYQAQKYLQEQKQALNAEIARVEKAYNESVLREREVKDYDRDAQQKESTRLGNILAELKATAPGLTGEYDTSSLIESAYSRGEAPGLRYEAEQRYKAEQAADLERLKERFVKQGIPTDYTSSTGQGLRYLDNQLIDPQGNTYKLEQGKAESSPGLALAESLIPSYSEAMSQKYKNLPPVDFAGNLFSITKTPYSYAGLVYPSRDLPLLSVGTSVPTGVPSIVNKAISWLEPYVSKENARGQTAFDIWNANRNAEIAEARPAIQANVEARQKFAENIINKAGAVISPLIKIQPAVSIGYAAAPYAVKVGRAYIENQIDTARQATQNIIWLGNKVSPLVSQVGRAGIMQAKLQYQAAQAAYPYVKQGAEYFNQNIFPYTPTGLTQQAAIWTGKNIIIPSLETQGALGLAQLNLQAKAVKAGAPLLSAAIRTSPAVIAAPYVYEYGIKPAVKTQMKMAQLAGQGISWLGTKIKPYSSPVIQAYRESGQRAFEGKSFGQGLINLPGETFDTFGKGLNLFFTGSSRYTGTPQLVYEARDSEGKLISSYYYKTKPEQVGQAGEFLGSTAFLVAAPNPLAATIGTSYLFGSDRTALERTGGALMILPSAIDFFRYAKEPVKEVPSLYYPPKPKISNAFDIGKPGAAGTQEFKFTEQVIYPRRWQYTQPRYAQWLGLEPKRSLYSPQLKYFVDTSGTIKVSPKGEILPQSFFGGVKIQRISPSQDYFLLGKLSGKSQLIKEPINYAELNIYQQRQIEELIKASRAAAKAETKANYGITITEPFFKSEAFISNLELRKFMKIKTEPGELLGKMFLPGRTISRSQIFGWQRKILEGEKVDLFKYGFANRDITFPTMKPRQFPTTFGASLIKKEISPGEEPFKITMFPKGRTKTPWPTAENLIPKTEIISAQARKLTETRIPKPKPIFSDEKVLPSYTGGEQSLKGISSIITRAKPGMQQEYIYPNVINKEQLKMQQELNLVQVSELTKLQQKELLRLEPKLEIRQEQIVRNDLAARQIPKLEAGSRLQSRQEQVPRTSKIFKFIPGSITREKPRTSGKKIITLEEEFKNKAQKFKRKKQLALFEIQVKRRGKFKSIGTERDLYSASRKGYNAVKNSLAASYRIMQKGKAVRAPLVSPELRLSKRNPLILVQKKTRPGRISTRGEKEEIRASRKKKIKFF